MASHIRHVLWRTSKCFNQKFDDRSLSRSGRYLRIHGHETQGLFILKLMATTRFIESGLAIIASFILCEKIWAKSSFLISTTEKTSTGG